MRQSIAGMMLVVAILALGLVALLRSTPLWAAAMTSLTIALLTIALIGTICGRGRTRASWAGFAVAGWVAAGVHFGGVGWILPGMANTLLSTAILDLLYEQIGPEPPADAAPGARKFGIPVKRPPPLPGAWESWTSPDPGAGGQRPLAGLGVAIQAPPASFHRIGACLAVLSSAMIGGLVARRFAGPDQEPTASP